MNACMHSQNSLRLWKRLIRSWGCAVLPHSTPPLHQLPLERAAFPLLPPPLADLPASPWTCQTPAPTPPYFWLLTKMSACVSKLPNLSQVTWTLVHTQRWLFESAEGNLLPVQLAVQLYQNNMASFFKRGSFRFVTAISMVLDIG